MNRKLMMFGLILAAGCSSSSSPSGASGDDASGDGPTQGDGTAPQDGTTPEEAGNPGEGGPETGTPETGGSDAGSDAGSMDAAPDSSDGASPVNEAGSDGEAGATCPSTWLDVPVVAALALPDGGVVLIHAAGSGFQDYACVGTPIDGGAEAGDAGDAGDTYAWTLTGPNAILADCNGTTIGHHFPSEAGATAPEWQTLDGTYVVGHKLAAYTPDGGAASVPWLLLQGTSHGGAGTLASVTYVQRLDTDGGIAPATGCDPSTVGATQAVPYTADYYFFGP